LVLHATAPSGNSRTTKVLVTAEYSGVPVKLVENFTLGVDNKTPQFLEKNPNGRIPVLETPEGPIWESNAIARYIARLGNKIYGNSPYETALIDQWVEWSRGDLEKAAVDWVYPIWGYGSYDAEATKRAQELVKAQLAILNTFLKFRSYLVGERVSLADIIVATSLSIYYSTVFDANFRKAIPNVNRWFTTVINQPNFKKVVPNFEIVEKAKTPAAPAPKKEEPKKEAPKKEAPKKEEEEESFEEPKKKNNPLDSLPPSKFVIDEWKRVYSNEKDTRTACEWFWNNFDPEGYSIWYSEYNYNSELDVVFKSCNLMGGFIQRLESLRKYGFGSLILFGSDGNLEISGVWVVRGKELPEELTGCPDYTSYTFTRLDHTNEAERKGFDDYLTWEGTFGGRSLPFNQGKIFK